MGTWSRLAGGPRREGCSHNAVKQGERLWGDFVTYCASLVVPGVQGLQTGQEAAGWGAWGDDCPPCAVPGLPLNLPLCPPMTLVQAVT